MAGVCWIPGPDPRVCRHCGGEMSLPHFGRHSGLWIRTCKDCREHTSTKQRPADLAPVRTGPLPSSPREADLPFERPLEKFTGTRTLARTYDARMRQTGEVA